MQQADLAFREAFVLCPYSPEAVFRYVNFLLQFHRVEDARLVVQIAVRLDTKNTPPLKQLLQNLEKMQGQ